MRAIAVGGLLLASLSVHAEPASRFDFLVVDTQCKQLASTLEDIRVDKSIDLVTVGPSSTGDMFCTRGPKHALHCDFFETAASGSPSRALDYTISVDTPAMTKFSSALGSEEVVINPLLHRYVSATHSFSTRTYQNKDVGVFLTKMCSGTYLPYDEAMELAKKDQSAKKSPAGRPSTRGFFCAKQPGIAGVRSCNVTDTSCAKTGGCFVRATSHCYVRSAIDPDWWSKTERTTTCFATAEECQKDHDGVGNWGPPPYHAECHEMALDEVAR